jgi:hypothetical protein
MWRTCCTRFRNTWTADKGRLLLDFTIIGGSPLGARCTWLCTSGLHPLSSLILMSVGRSTGDRMNPDRTIINRISRWEISRWLSEYVRARRTWQTAIRRGGTFHGAMVQLAEFVNESAHTCCWLLTVHGRSVWSSAESVPEACLEDLERIRCYSSYN